MSQLITGQVEYLPTGLGLPEHMPYEDWKQLGVSLQTMRRSWQWWMGDWLNYGESLYGEKYTQAIEATGKSVQTLMNCAWVAGQIEISRRREILSWSHHSEVAKLEPDEQDKLLETAEKDGLSVSALRKHKRQEPAEPVVEPVEPVVEEQIDLPPVAQAVKLIKSLEVRDLETLADLIVSLNPSLARKFSSRKTTSGYTSDFEHFWSVFPSGRKTKKGKAFAAWNKAIRKASPDDIIDAAAEYALSDVGNGEYVQGPEPWLNGSCWEDDRHAWSSPKALSPGQKSLIAGQNALEGIDI